MGIEPTIYAPPPPLKPPRVERIRGLLMIIISLLCILLLVSIIMLVILIDIDRLVSRIVFP